MKPVLLIWDIDGTLMNSKGIGRRAMNNTFKTLYNIDNGFDKVSMSGRLDYHIVKNAHMHHNIEGYDVDNFYNMYEEELKKEILKDNSAMVLPGIRDILESKKDNIFHILGTGNCQVGARLKLDYVGLDHYFTLGGFGDEDLDRWEIINKAYNKAKTHFNKKFDSRDTYVIGDTPYDVECAKKLGFKSIAVSTGSHSMDELKECDADFLLNELSLDTIINIING